MGRELGSHHEGGKHNERAHEIYSTYQRACEISTGIGKVQAFNDVREHIIILITSSKQADPLDTDHQLCFFEGYEKALEDVLKIINLLED